MGQRKTLLNGNADTTCLTFLLKDDPVNVSLGGRERGGGRNSELLTETPTGAALRVPLLVLLFKPSIRSASVFLSVVPRSGIRVTD